MSLGLVDQTSKGWTLLEIPSDTIIEVTLVDRSLEDVGTVDEGWPAVNEIRVETIAGSVTIGEYPSRSTRSVEGEFLNLEDELVEKFDKFGRVTSWTVAPAVVITVHRPGHVRFVIG